MLNVQNSFDQLNLIDDKRVDNSIPCSVILETIQQGIWEEGASSEIQGKWSRT